MGCQCKGIQPLFDRLKGVVAVALVVAFSALGAHANGASPRQVVENFHGTLLDVMKQSKKLGYNGRYQELGPAIAQTFHLPMMAKVIAGRHWSEFNGEQQSTLIDAFARMTTATYASRFNGYSGEKFVMVEEVPLQENARMVKTQIVKSDGEPVEINYLLRQFENGWRVIDIYLKGAYSELATRRSEYVSVLDRQGLDGLVRTIDGKVAQLAHDQSG
jgi:phospholipid transport system substrate-binding protein